MMILSLSAMLLGYQDPSQSGPSVKSFIFASSMSSKCFTLADIPEELRTKYDDLVRRIYVEIWRPENEFRPGDSVSVVAARLITIADRAQSFTGFVSSESRHLIEAELIVGWIRSNMEYWGALNQMQGRERHEWNTPTKVLSHSPRPKGNCDGYSRLAVALASEMGVKCIGIGGHVRDDNGGIGSAQGDTELVQGIPWNHGWNVFEIGGKLLPADIAGAYHYREQRFRTSYSGKTDACQVLPMRLEEWEFFLAKHRTLQWDSKPILGPDPFSTMDLQIWVKSVFDYSHLRAKLRDRDVARNLALAR